VLIRWTTFVELHFGHRHFFLPCSLMRSVWLNFLPHLVHSYSYTGIGNNNCFSRFPLSRFSQIRRAGHGQLAVQRFTLISCLYRVQLQNSILNNV